MSTDSSFGRYRARCRRISLHSAVVAVLTFTGAQIHAVPGAAQTGSTDTQATQEEEAIDDLLTDEEEIKFKRQPPPAGSHGANRRDDPTSGPEAPAPVDPEQVITSPTTVDPARGPLSKEEKHAAQIYVDDAIEKRLDRVAGRVPDDEIEHHVVYTPSPAAQQDPNRKVLERQLWKQRLADYKQAKLAERLLNDLDGGNSEQAGAVGPGNVENDPFAGRGGAAPAGGERSDGQSGSLLERLIGAGGGGGSKADASDQSDTGAGGDESASGTEGTFANRDPAARDAETKDQVSGSAPRGPDAQPLGTVALGEPPSAPRGQSTAFDKFVAESGILGRQGETSGSGADGDSAATAPAPQDSPDNAKPGARPFSAVPKPKPMPPETSGATATASSRVGGTAASHSGEAANATNSQPSVGTSGSPTGGQSARAARELESKSQSAFGTSGQDGSAAPTPLSDVLAAATAALDRAGPPETSLPDPHQSPETTDQSAAPAVSAGQPETAAATEVAPGAGEVKEEPLVANLPIAPAEQLKSSSKSFADRFSFSRDIAALSPDAIDLVPSTLAPPASAPEMPQRQEFERVAMEKFIAQQPLDPVEQEFIAQAQQASAAKSAEQINEQTRSAAELQNTAMAVRQDVAEVIEASGTNDKLAYLQPAADAASSDARTVQAGSQTIEVAANHPSGRTPRQIAYRARDSVDRQPESDGPIKLYRPDKVKPAEPATDINAQHRRPADQAAARNDRQTRQSERLAAKLEREAHHESTKVRFDNCVLFIFCSLTRLVLPQASPEEPAPGRPADSGDGVQRVRP